MIVRERKIDRKMQSSAGLKHIKKMHEIAFDSIGDLLENAKPRPNDHISMDWVGVRKLHQLEYKIDNGWPEMEDKMNTMLEEISPPPAELRPEMNRRRRRRKREFGNEVDIHAVRQGQLDRAWDATEVVEVETVGNKLVHININLSATAGTRFDAGLWRGAAAMRIFDVLTRMGKSVAISGTYASYGTFKGGGHGMVSCRLKSYGEPLRTDRLAGMVTLGFMRHFLMMRGLDTMPGKVPGYGRGYPIDDYKLLTYAAEEDQQHGGAVVSIGQCFDRKQAQDVVDKFIRQYVKNDDIEGLSSYEMMKNWSSQEQPHFE